MAIYIRRREFIGTLGGAAAAWPLVARAQQPDGVRRIGVLMGFSESDPEAQAYIAALQDGLQKLGWTEGRNTRIDTRWATPADADSMQRFAKELVALQPDLIFSNTTPTTAALLQHTRSIPIVFTMVADPIGSGFVASFPRPGGNVTGFVVTEGSLGGKWLELLKEIAPRVAKVAMSVAKLTESRNGIWALRVSSDEPLSADQGRNSMPITSDKKGRCRLHGGASGSGGPPGERNGQYRHGERTSTLLKMLRAGLI
jgi:ABC-type uncharacterized transport system substrate-binding protein